MRLFDTTFINFIQSYGILWEEAKRYKQEETIEIDIVVKEIFSWRPMVDRLNLEFGYLSYPVCVVGNFSANFRILFYAAASMPRNDAGKAMVDD